jgi:hypothetical protein
MNATHFINTLQKPVLTPIAFGATLINRRTGEERNIDILVSSDRLSDLYREIRKLYSTEWEIFETWEI